MEENSFLFELLAGVAYLFVGVRLLRLSQRTRALPERLLGLYFAFSGASYVLYELAIIFDVGPTTYAALFFSGRVTYMIGVLPFLLFLQNVFHRDEAWAHWLAGTCAVVLFMGVIFSALGGDMEGVALDNKWFWFEWVGYTLPFCWLAMDTLLAYRSAKRRVRIGLIDPVLANRYLLWAFFAASQVAVSFALLLMYVEYAAVQTFTAWTDFAVGGLEMCSVGTLWLVFFAPAFYRRWLEGGAAREPDTAAS
jgi:hypothetical protein